MSFINYLAKSLSLAYIIEKVNGHGVGIHGEYW